MRSFGQVLDQNKGIGHGFDLLRLFLASSVVFWHSFVVIQGTDQPYHESWLWIYKFAVLPCFFGLSGFLVAGSAFRLSLGEFLTNRAFRIVPALTVDVILSALVLGPIFTTATLHEYFSDRRFWTYFENVLGLIHFKLPGVFTQNPLDYVNMSLWTVPFEIACYIMLAAIILLGWLKKPSCIIILVLFYFLLSILFVNFTGLPSASSGTISRIVWFIFAPNAANTSGPSLVPIFLCGCLCYIFRYRIPYNRHLLTLCLVCMALLAVFGEWTWETQPVFQLVSIPIFIYTTIYIGLLDVHLPALFKNNDYSYGIYLYGWPLQQAVAATFPDLKNPWLGFIVAFVPLLVFAAFSWHVIERPILKLRRKLRFMQSSISPKQLEQLQANPPVRNVATSARPGHDRLPPEELPVHSPNAAR